jgi:hypothetical protein
MDDFDIDMDFGFDDFDDMSDDYFDNIFGTDYNPIKDDGGVPTDDNRLPLPGFEENSNRNWQNSFPPLIEQTHSTKLTQPKPLPKIGPLVFIKTARSKKFEDSFPKILLKEPHKYHMKVVDRLLIMNNLRVVIVFAASPWKEISNGIEIENIKSVEYGMVDINLCFKVPSFNYGNAMFQLVIYDGSTKIFTSTPFLVRSRNGTSKKKQRIVNIYNVNEMNSNRNNNSINIENTFNEPYQTNLAQKQQSDREELIKKIILQQQCMQFLKWKKQQQQKKQNVGLPGNGTNEAPFIID